MERSTVSRRGERAGYRLHVWRVLRGPGQRLLLPEWLAITIGRHIFAWRRLDDVELAHELAHVEQWRRYGITFAVRYLWASRRITRAGGDGYRDNPFEVEARAAADALRQPRP